MWDNFKIPVKFSDEWDDNFILVQQSLYWFHSKREWEYSLFRTMLNVISSNSLQISSTYFKNTYNYIQSPCFRGTIFYLPGAYIKAFNYEDNGIFFNSGIGSVHFYLVGVTLFVE